MNSVTQKIINQIPELSGLDIKSLNIQRLGGLTNLVYKIQTKNKKYILRLPGAGTEAYIDRNVEAHNARLAAEAGVSAHIYYSDIDSGLMLTEFLLGETMTSKSFKLREGSPTRAGRVMKKLHSSDKQFQFCFELFDMIDKYLNTIFQLKVELPDGYHNVLKQAEPVRKALLNNPVKLTPCHCDPLAENFLDDGERMWMVDWEYSGMNDPMWDLGDLSEEANFNTEQDTEMLNAYCDGLITENLQGRMIIYKAMSNLLWTLWGLIQHANNNPADDFLKFALNKFEACRNLMNQSEFSRHISKIR